jgi:hypothetical protein
MNRYINFSFRQLSYTVCLSIILALLIGFNSGCQTENSQSDNSQSDNSNPYETGKYSCLKTKVISETPSPDGQLKAIVYQYDDSCKRYYMENLAIQPNNSKALKYENSFFYIYNGENLRPIWQDNRNLLVLGDKNQHRFVETDTRHGLGMIRGEGYKQLNSGETISFGVGFFDTLTLTYQQESYQVTHEVLDEVFRPDLSEKQSYRQAQLHRYECVRQSDGLVTKEMVVKIDFFGGTTPTHKPYSNTQAYCTDRRWNNDYVYVNSSEIIPNIKWTNNNELMISSSEPNGEKGLLQKTAKELIGGKGMNIISIKYEQTK